MSFVKFQIREAVTGLASITEDIQSKTEQVWAVVQGMDGSQVRDAPVSQFDSLVL